MPAPLRVLLILENPGAGSGRHVLDLAKGLLDKGETVHLIYSPFRLERWFAESIDRMPGLVARSLPMAHAPGPRDLWTAARLRHYLRRQGPFHIIHGHSSKGGALARLAPLCSGVIRVYTPHALVTLDPLLSKLEQFIYGSVERVLGYLSAAIICVSEEERNHAIELGLPAAKLFVVHNGIPLLPPSDRAAERRALGLEEDALCVGFVGRMEPQKCVERLLTAFARIHHSVPNLRLVLVGEGSESSSLRRKAQQFGIQDAIRWAGRANGPRLMSAFDLFALPSRYEGFPYVLIEALQRGLPIVTMNVGGATAVVRPDHNGFIVSEGNVDAFACALLKLCKNPQLRQRMSAAAIVRSTEFSQEQMVRRTREIYVRLANHPPRH